MHLGTVRLIYEIGHLQGFILQVFTVTVMHNCFFINMTLKVGTNLYFAIYFFLERNMSSFEVYGFFEDLQSTSLYI